MRRRPLVPKPEAPSEAKAIKIEKEVYKEMKQGKGLETDRQRKSRNSEKKSVVHVQKMKEENE